MYYHTVLNVGSPFWLSWDLSSEPCPRDVRPDNFSFGGLRRKSTSKPIQVVEKNSFPRRCLPEVHFSGWRPLSGPCKSASLYSKPATDNLPPMKSTSCFKSWTSGRAQALFRVHLIRTGSHVYIISLS